jgi:DNA-binding NarL/FixJ family response regulator
MRTLTNAALKDEKCTIPRAWLESINRRASAFAKRQAHMMTEFINANGLDEDISLTNREKDILVDLTQGLSRTEIAASRNISTNTVKAAINLIYEKLHATNLVDAIRIATDRKFI